MFFTLFVTMITSAIGYTLVSSYKGNFMQKYFVTVYNQIEEKSMPKEIAERAGLIF